MRAGDDGVSFEPAAPSVTQDVLRRLLGPVTDQAAYHMPFPELLNQSTRGYLPIDGFFGGLPTHRMVISGDPRRELLAMADRIELVNQDDAEAVEIDGQVCDVIQIVRPAANLIPRFPYWGGRRGAVVTFYHYIARDSGLILRTQFQFDFATTFHSAFGARPAQIVEYRIDHQQIRLNPPLDGDVFRILDPIPITPGVH